MLLKREPPDSPNFTADPDSLFFTKAAVHNVPGGYGLGIAGEPVFRNLNGLPLLGLMRDHEKRVVPESWLLRCVSRKIPAADRLPFEVRGSVARSSTTTTARRPQSLALNAGSKSVAARAVFIARACVHRFIIFTVLP